MVALARINATYQRHVPNMATIAGQLLNALGIN
jgi:hypothetical protein